MQYKAALTYLSLAIRLKFFQEFLPLEKKKKK